MLNAHALMVTQSPVSRAEPAHVWTQMAADVFEQLFSYQEQTMKAALELNTSLLDQVRILTEQRDELVEALDALRDEQGEQR
jgi:hypothetical protein